MASTLHAAIAQLGRSLGMLEAFLADVRGPEHLLRLLGWELPPAVSDIGLATVDLSGLVDAIDELDVMLTADSPDGLQVSISVGEVAIAFADVIDAFNTLSEGFNATPDYLSRTKIADEFLRRLLDLVVVQSLLVASDSAFAIGQLLGVIALEPREADPAIFQVEHHRHVVHWERLPRLIGEPGSLMRDVYQWGTAEFDVEKLLLAAVTVLSNVGVAGATRALPAATEEQLMGRPVPEAIADPALQFFVSLFKGIGFDPVDVGLSLFPLRPTVGGGADGGVGISPFAISTSDTEFPLADRIALALEASLDLDQGLALLLRPGQDPEFRIGLLSDPAAVADAGDRLLATLRFAEPEGERRVVLAAADGVGLDVAGFSIGAGVSGALDPILTAAIEDGRLFVAPASPDGFLAAILPAEGLSAEFDLAVEWSRSGVAFRGGAGLRTDIPLNRAIGPFQVRAAHLGLSAAGNAVRLEASLSGSVVIGPLTLVVERIGLEGLLEFTSGNLGPVSAELDLKLPSGVGLSIDGGGFRGGGFLRHEPEHHRYVGALELEFQDTISLKAIGLLTTQLPGGAAGFSLLTVISAEFNPVQLGFGFTLNGVGGLIGLNRTVRVERLRTGLRDSTLDSILFPTDIVANANRIISDLAEVYPPQADRFVFGPIAKIGWGTPTLITGSLGLIIEVPDPVRVVIPGIIKAVLPDEKKTLLRLQVNFVGALDTERSLVSFDATIHDSRLLSFPLSGDMAFRLSYGTNPNFLLTVGGFHPAYDPPPLALPALRRLTVQLLSGDSPRLKLETYFAVTSNTVQFGARLELYAAAGKFNVYGFLTFDALFQFNPFYVTAAIGAMLALRVGTRSIKSISLSMTLEGPAPWTAAGTAKLKLFWFLTVKVRFNKTFGEVRDTRLDDIDVLPLLIAALESPGNWRAEMPPSRHRLVSVNDTQPDADTIVAHPNGVLAVSQKVVPLNVLIDRLGNQRPRDAQEFRIGEPQVNELTLRTQPAREQFAPAQFFDRTDSEKLAAKSFEHYDSGIRIVESEKLSSSHHRRRKVIYDLHYIDSQRNVSRRFQLPPIVDTFVAWASNGAVAGSPLSHAKTAESSLAPDAVRVAQEGFAVVSTGDISPLGDAAASEAEAMAMMRRLIRDQPELAGRIQVVPTFELSN